MATIVFRVSEELKERAEVAAAGESRTLSNFLRSTLEKALGNRGGPPAGFAGDEAVTTNGPAPAPSRASERDRAAETLTHPWVQRYMCPRDCKSSYRPTSPNNRCPDCRREVVPVASERGE